MSNVIKNFLGYLKLNDDDEFDDYDDEFEEEFEAKERKRLEKEEKERQRAAKELNEKPLFERKSTKAQAPRAMEEKEITIPEPRKERNLRMERTASNKIVPIRTTPKGLEVCIMKPSSFEDSQDICDMLLSGRASVVNLEGFDPLDAQRIMDFISGCVYAINGKLHQISKYIFIFSPDSIDISGDYLEFMPDEGFEVPTLNKDF